MSKGSTGNVQPQAYFYKILIMNLIEIKNKGTIFKWSNRLKSISILLPEAPCNDENTFASLKRTANSFEK
jgi:hypothetical protein